MHDRKKVLNEAIDAQREGGLPSLDLELTAKCTGASCIYCDSKPEVCSFGHPNEIQFDILEKVINIPKKN